MCSPTDEFASMARFVLDTGVVIGFQKAGRLDDLVDASRVVSLALIEEAFDEIVRPRNGKHKAAAASAQAALTASGMTIIALDVAGPEATTLAELRSGKTSPSDLGEAASIAYSIHHDDCTFVTNDAAAALQSLGELRGRTMAFFPFVAHLVESEAMKFEVAELLAMKIPTLPDWRAVIPTWWRAFGVSRAPSASLRTRPDDETR